ncbi:MAG: hypothetical protein NZ898_02680 [Myxococcota bacterium]|nr:hypothetical protein [Myxococcota bacterium]
MTAAVVVAQDGPPVESVDRTRLDVERLPPEAVRVDRDMYAHGVYVEGRLGARWLRGGAGRYLEPGPGASLGVGVEALRWLWIGARGEMSMHETRGPSPPSPTAVEILSAVLEARLQWNLGSRLALWAGVDGGVAAATGRYLQLFGIDDAGSVALVGGANAGIDWHFVHLHYSAGVAGGARLLPSLRGPDGERAIGVELGAYLRYVL